MGGMTADELAKLDIHARPGRVLEVLYSSGKVESLTLEVADEFIDQADNEWLRVEIFPATSPVTRVRESVRIQRCHVASYRIYDTTLRNYVKPQTTTLQATDGTPVA